MRILLSGVERSGGRTKSPCARGLRDFEEVAFWVCFLEILHRRMVIR